MMQGQTIPLVDLRKIPEVDLDYYFTRLMPRNLPHVDPNDKYDNAIEQRHIYVYGKQGKGKTNVTKLIVNRAVETYGQFNVAVQRTNAENFRQLLESDWERKPIQVIILEDATDVGIPKDELADFFRIRHKMYEKTGAREGLVIMIFCCHRLHETPIALRSDYDSLLVLGVPMNDWDYNFIASKVGEESVEVLDEADENNEKGNVIVTYRRKFLGIAKIPKLTFSIPIRDITSPANQAAEPHYYRQHMQPYQARPAQAYATPVRQTLPDNPKPVRVLQLPARFNPDVIIQRYFNRPRRNDNYRNVGRDRRVRPVEMGKSGRFTKETECKLNFAIFMGILVFATILYELGYRIPYFKFR